MVKASSGQPHLNGREDNFILKSFNTKYGTFFYDSNWGSNNPNHRKLLRSYLAKELLNPTFLDLKKAKIVPYISNSHTKMIGGYFKSNNNLTAGFDLEEQSRISEKLVARVSSKEEIHLIGNKYSHFIWPIKEAGFKAFSNIISTLSEIEVFKVTPASSNGFYGQIKAGNKIGLFHAGTLNSDHLFATVVVNGK